MANIDRIINVQVALNTTGISAKGFSSLMIVGPHVYDVSRVLTITDSDQLLEMGFPATSPIYKAAVDAFGQTPHIKEVKIGRFQCDTAVIKAVGDITDGTYSFAVKTMDEDGNIISTDVTFEASENSATEVSNGLKSALESSGLNSTFTASLLGEDLQIKAKEQTLSFAVEPNARMEILSFAQADGIDIAENMALISAVDDDYYGIAYTSRVQEDILAMAEWTEAHTKLFGTAIAESGAKTSEVKTDTGYKLKDGNFYRTFWFYHEKADTDYPEVAVMSRCFTILPGGETWANKKLAGVSTDHLRENEYQAITKKNGNTFEIFADSVSITQNGKVAAGEWIDVIRFRDWLVETIKTEEFSMLINRDKLPYTDAGIALVESVLNQVLTLGQRRGGIAPTEYDEDGNKNVGFKISVPLASSVSANVKASRVLSDVTFVARLAGAIHAVEISGSLTYENLIEA